MSGRWHAFLASATHEPRVVLLASSQPWGHKTRDEALRYLRPVAQAAAKRARMEADLLEAALHSVDLLMARGAK